MVYLNRTKGELFDFYKAGFATRFEKRRSSYITDNPCVEFLEGVNTYKKTKHQLEIQIQEELEKMGYKRVVTNGVQTEWFIVPKGTEIHLSDLKCCKGRKVYELNN